MYLVDSISHEDKLILEKSTVFKGIPLNELDPFIKTCQIRIYSPGQMILSSGDFGDGLYVVLNGTVEVFLPHVKCKQQKYSSQGFKNSLAILETGACFGEYSLVDMKKVSASVDALTPVRIFYLSTNNFHQITKEHLRLENIIYKNILHILVSRCREANEELEEDAFIIY